MAAEIISGKEVAKAIRAELKEEVAELTAGFPLYARRLGAASV